MPHPIVDLTDWQALSDTLDALQKKIRLTPAARSWPCWFRGQERSAWGLDPSLMRVAILQPKRSLHRIESDLFFEFRKDAIELQDVRDPLELLYFMRHHGLPTRLLDWTESFGVALYFALAYRRETADGGPDTWPSIWLLNPYRLNTIAWQPGLYDTIDPCYLFAAGESYATHLANEDEQDLNWDQPVALHPRSLIVPRMRAQRGFFTIHGTDRRPLEAQASKAVAQVRLAPSCWPAALRFLDLAGFNEAMIFPDLDGLARSLLVRHGLMRSAAPPARLDPPPAT